MLRYNENIFTQRVRKMTCSRICRTLYKMLSHFFENVVEQRRANQTS